MERGALSVGFSIAFTPLIGLH
ncbi:MAG: hypothetical protein Q8N08_09525 [Methanobacteriaceae archaeon]|nr:hypothetical protein [Methanobacteriaceae archaeon]